MKPLCHEEAIGCPAGSVIRDGIADKYLHSYLVARNLRNITGTEKMQQKLLSEYAPADLVFIEQKFIEFYNKKHAPSGHSRQQRK